MFVFFCLLVIIVLLNLKFCKNGIDKNYLSKDYTSSIKGVCIILVFISHARGYIEFNGIFDNSVIKLLDLIGQLMVTLFLFYSGYGVYESIKSKGNAYIDNFFSNRILKTFFDFSIAIFMFYILGLLIGKHYSIKMVLLSLIGWKSIGNSNWYMFAIFTLYIFTLISFKLFKNKRFYAILLLSSLTLLYVYVMSDLQPSRFSNTYLCYTAGVWYSYLKEKIDYIISKYNFSYYVFLVLTIFIFIQIYPDRMHRLMYYNATSIVFCLLVVLLSMKFSIKSDFLIWSGSHLFWLFILQRIPMKLIIHYWRDLNPNIFLFFSFIITIIAAYYMQIYTGKLKDKIWKNMG